MSQPRREPDFSQFLRAVTRTERPAHLPFYEHIASPGFIARRTGVPFDRMGPDDPGYWETVVDFWLGMGYDCVPMEVSPNIPLPQAAHSEDNRTFGSESHRVIASWEDFERFPWPAPDNLMPFGYWETVAGLLPEGAKIVGGVCMGPYEWASNLMGVEGLSLAIYLQPDLVRAVFDKINETHLACLRNIVDMDAMGALRQGDDLGFKTSTFLSPDHLREYVFPIYRQMTGLAHAHGKPFVLHSCGNLAEVYDDLIDGCGIDAKHSFEDVILPVTEFKRRFGHRVTPLGGLDVDKICRMEEPALRAYTRETVEACFADGFWTLGTGNSLTDYMPVENYLIVLDEGMRVAG
ncbi:MAG: uroporphyrinogen-III decarboxylase-like protein [Candidatus Hydrogenedentes bacterium]|nr:uroporphyrinogen-III decarboxylase-like protein [Candidatus Hydrogenedentota bacterium]